MARSVLIAVDVADQNACTIMQALPNIEPFIGGSAGKYNLDIAVDLPPLVPGFYSLDFWIGPHNTETADFVRQAIRFEIIGSPTNGRTFPHSPDHGSIVPISRANVRTSENASQTRTLLTFAS